MGAPVADEASELLRVIFVAGGTAVSGALLLLLLLLAGCALGRRVEVTFSGGNADDALVEVFDFVPERLAAIS